MKGKLKHYKMTRYKAHRKPIDKRVLAIVLSSLTFIVLAVLLGKHLDGISNASTPPSDTSSEQSVQSYDAYPKLEVGKLFAYPLEEGAYASEEEAKNAILRLNGAYKSAVSIKLLDRLGAPAYKSGVYESIYSAKGSEFDLGAFIGEAAKNNITALGIFPVRAFTEENGASATARRSFELSLLCEAYELGIRDVLLLIDNPSDVDSLYEITSAVKARCPELLLGVSAEYSLLCSDSALYAKLDDVVDYIAFDFTDTLKSSPSEDTADTAAPDTTDGEGDTQPLADPIAALKEALDSSEVHLGRFPSRVYIEVNANDTATISAICTALENVYALPYVLNTSNGAATDAE